MFGYKEVVQGKWFYKTEVRACVMTLTYNYSIWEMGTRRSEMHIIVGYRVSLRSASTTNNAYQWFPSKAQGTAWKVGCEEI